MREKIFYATLWLLGMQYCQSIINSEYFTTDGRDKESYSGAGFITHRNLTRIKLKSLQHQDLLNRSLLGSLNLHKKSGDDIQSLAEIRLADRPPRQTDAAKNTTDDKGSTDAAGAAKLTQMKWIGYLLAFVFIILTTLVLVVLALFVYLLG